MARPPRAGVVSAYAHPIVLAILRRSPQRRGLIFNHMRDLIAVLSAVSPRVLEDPNFLDRSLLVDGVPVSVSSLDMIQSILGVQTAVLVRDTHTGFRVGLLVFSDAFDSAEVMIQATRPGLYATCTPATRPGKEVSRNYILDGVSDECARRHMASLFRSLLPTEYMLIRASRATISDGAYGLCDLAWKVLFVRGFVVAAIISSDRQTGVLVFDDSECTELVARRAPQLLLKTGLQLFDSSLFPLLTDPADRDLSLLGRLLPHCVMSDEESYRRRVLLFTGLELDSHKLDAAEFAQFLYFEADIIHAVEAVIIHRSEGLVAVVLGSSEDAISLLHTPKETWLRFFRQTPGCASVFGFAGCEAVSLDISSQQPSAMIGGIYWTSTEVSDRVKKLVKEGIKVNMQKLNGDDTNGFVDCLIRECALAHFDSVLRDDFAQRSLLLSGVGEGISKSDLDRLLSGFGELDASATENESRMGLAMVVFKCWHAAARLLRESPDTWARLGFHECTPVPDAEKASSIAQEVQDQIFMAEMVAGVLE